MDAERRCYALAGAMAVETGTLLKALHRMVGPPGELEEIPPRRRNLLPAATRTYGAAAACSALTARLLLAERDVIAGRLGDSHTAQIAEPGVTVLESTQLAAWRGTMRATAAALGELMSSVAAWQSVSDTDSEHISATLARLTDYADELGRILEVSEPTV